MPETNRPARSAAPPAGADAAAGLRVEIRTHLRGLAPATWDGVVGAEGCPFFEHAFLFGLEASGCVGEGTGWSPRYVLAWRGAALVGALPLYRKDHSEGEFIFDWAWAEAAERAGMAYYPKLVVAAPFSPVGGRRFLLAPGAGEAEMEALLAGAQAVAQREGASGLHWLFVEPEEAAFLEARGFAVRHTHQFQWRNAGYPDFEAFLGRFRSKRRNQIRRERREVAEAGVTTRVLEGEAITAEHMAHAWRFYRSTVAQFAWGRQYLNRRFFDHLLQHFRHRLSLVLAEQPDGLGGVKVVGGALNVRGAHVLYGRYWGCGETVRHLHFEVCSYAGIEHAIGQGLQRFEAGAGGGAHKYGRGFLPTVTLSAHALYLPGLDAAVRVFLAREREALAAQLVALEGEVLKCEPPEGSGPPEG